MFVVPSQALEGFGLITVEALSSGLPVMATPIGGNKEILQGFRPELLFKSSSSDHMAEGMIHMLSNRKLLPGAGMNVGSMYWRDIPGSMLRIK